MNQVECVIIGAGVIGLACARVLAQQGLEVIILEAESGIGTGTSSRNSEVIHAGIYYPAGSNKSKWCVTGKKQLYTYCKEKNIPHKQIGKLIVATLESEIATLEQITAKAAANGVTDLQYLNAHEVHELEPNVAAVAALLSPSTGIIDSHSLMVALLGDATAAGAMLAVNSKVVGGTIAADHVVLQVVTDAEITELQAKYVINCAGLFASTLSYAISGIARDQIPQTYYRKGSYFSYAAADPFQRLIYPVPVPGGLGTHSTVDLAGKVRFGPDVEWIEEVNYDVDPNKRNVFAAAIKRYWPQIKIDLLQPGYSGIRPSLLDKSGADQYGNTFQDFCVRLHDLPQSNAKFLGLYGIESPGLTSCLAIADNVASLIKAQ